MIRRGFLKLTGAAIAAMCGSQVLGNLAPGEPSSSTPTKTPKPAKHRTANLNVCTGVEWDGEALYGYQQTWTFDKAGHLVKTSDTTKFLIDEAEDWS